MSQDEIIFEEIRYREPERLRRPDRDRRWACLAYEVPGPTELPIFLEWQTADAIERHALRDTSVELGGILLGKECVDDLTGTPFVLVTKSLEAKHFENTQASFTYTHDSWEEITRERDRLYPELDIVGWYHTHPDFGIFLSSHDLFIHRHFFAQPLQVAYVVDPLRQTRGFFQWRDGDLHPLEGFSLCAERSDRIGLARLVNDLENIPNADGGGGGGGLSPRLEAELIAMLTRPATHHPSTPLERTQAAILFTMLGAFVGSLLLGGVVWLNMLNHRVQDQTDALAKLESTTEQMAAGQRLALDTMLADATRDTDRFASQYDRMVRERDEARKKIDRFETERDALLAQNYDLKKGNVELKAKLDDAGQIVALYKEAKRDYKDVPTRIAAFEADSERKAKQIDALERVLDTVEGKKVAVLLRKYDRTWYTALAGWGVGLLVALGVLANIALHQPEPVPEPLPGPASEEAGPTHRIT